MFLSCIARIILTRLLDVRRLDGNVRDLRRTAAEATFRRHLSALVKATTPSIDRMTEEQSLLRGF